jgi:hypothetical protein
MNSARAIVTVMLLTAPAGCLARAPGGTAGNEPVTSAAATADAHRVGPAAARLEADACPGDGLDGPTIVLNYSEESLKKNPIRSFMYFIPLISPVPVARHVCPENRQQAGILSYEKKTTGRSFTVTCEFEMSGDGYCKFVFDPDAMVTHRLAEAKKANGQDLANLLDYINFEGEGCGVVRIKGTITDSVETVTEVALEFNGRGQRSPVTIGLYEVKCQDGQYCYENRTNEIVARVNSLVFKKSENPRMAITVASISHKADGNGLLAQIKAAVANLFLKPVRITLLGNETMLRFGNALAVRKPTFTFPKAVNMKETTIVAAAPRRK